MAPRTTQADRASGAGGAGGANLAGGASGAGGPTRSGSAKKDGRGGASRKAKAERGARVRFLPTGAEPQLDVQGSLPFLPPSLALTLAEMDAPHNANDANCLNTSNKLNDSNAANDSNDARTRFAHELVSSPALHLHDANDRTSSRAPKAPDTAAAADSDTCTWTALAECDAHFPLSAWDSVMQSLVEHPERNSSYILRADILTREDHTQSRDSAIRREGRVPPSIPFSSSDTSPNSRTDPADLSDSSSVTGVCTSSAPPFQSPARTTTAKHRPSRLNQVICATTESSDLESEEESEVGPSSVHTSTPTTQYSSPRAPHHASSPSYEGYQLRQTVYRRLLPRNPTLDRPMDQICYFYRRPRRAALADDLAEPESIDPLSGSCTPFSYGVEHTRCAKGKKNGEGEDAGDGAVIYVPLLPHGAGESDIPWYHPRVRALAFRYLSLPSFPVPPPPQCAQAEGKEGGNALPDGTPVQGTLRIDALLFPPSDNSKQTQRGKHQEHQHQQQQQGSKAPTPDALLHANGNASIALDPSSRLMRTCKALLDLQHKHALGIARSYIKRVHHDILVPQAAFQDRYLALKSKYAPRLFQSWKEATDPKKHVHEDLAIAAYLIELWSRTYPCLPCGCSSSHSPSSSSQPSSSSNIDSSSAPTAHRKLEISGLASPPGGFVDLGCGNGLLVHLLRSEGFHGFGVDVRARQSWAQYETQPHAALAERDLRVLPLDPLELVTQVVQAHEDGEENRAGQGTGKDLRLLTDLLPRNSFLIGNHADELTPWIPLLAACIPGDQVGFLNIPCCPWRLEGDRFGRTAFDVTLPDVRDALRCAGHQHPSDRRIQEVRAAVLLGPPAEGQAPPTVPEAAHKTIESGERGRSSVGPSIGPVDVRGPAQARTRNAAYLAYVSWLQLQAGWMVEKEPLRIPSTKNWALVGRVRAWVPEEHFVYLSRPRGGDEQAGRTLVAGNARMIRSPPLDESPSPSSHPRPNSSSNSSPHTNQDDLPWRKVVLRHIGSLVAGIHSWTPRVPEGLTARLAPSSSAGHAEQGD